MRREGKGGRRRRGGREGGERVKEVEKKERREGGKREEERRRKREGVGYTTTIYCRGREQGEKARRGGEGEKWVILLLYTDTAFTI